MQVAAELFSRKGYTETTMQDIADQLDVSKPTLYAYTEGKRQILQDIIKHWMCSADRVLDKVEQHPDQETRFQLLVRGWTEIAIENAEVTKVFQAEEQDLPPRFVQQYRKWSDKAYKRILRIFTDNQSNGIFSKDMELTVATFTFIAFFNMLPRWYSKKGKLSLDDVSQSFLSIMKRAFAAEKSPAAIVK